MSGPALQQTKTGVSVATASAERQRDWRDRFWQAGWIVLACVCAGAAVVLELASKRNASVARAGTQPGSIRYDAGWPFAYARVHLSGLAGPAWDTAVHQPPPASAINWVILIVDCGIMTTVIILGTAIIIAGWRLALRLRHNESRKEMGEAIIAGLAVATVWAAVSTGVALQINQSQPTDAAANAQLTQPALLVSLAPGVAGYEIERWFESDAGPNISLSDGLANIVEGGVVLGLTTVFPGALLTMLALSAFRLARRLK